MAMEIDDDLKSMCETLKCVLNPGMCEYALDRLINGRDCFGPILHVGEINGELCRTDLPK
jgi:hypothetical protein